MGAAIAVGEAVRFVGPWSACGRRPVSGRGLHVKDVDGRRLPLNESMRVLPFRYDRTY